MYGHKEHSVDSRGRLRDHRGHIVAFPVEHRPGMFRTWPHEGSRLVDGDGRLVQDPIVTPSRKPLSWPSPLRSLPQLLDHIRYEAGDSSKRALGYATWDACSRYTRSSFVHVIFGRLPGGPVVPKELRLHRNQQIDAGIAVYNVLTSDDLNAALSGIDPEDEHYWEKFREALSTTLDEHPQLIEPIAEAISADTVGLGQG